MWGIQEDTTRHMHHQRIALNTHAHTYTHRTTHLSPISNERPRWQKQWRRIRGAMDSPVAPCRLVPVGRGHWPPGSTTAQVDRLKQREPTGHTPPKVKSEAMKAPLLHRTDDVSNQAHTPAYFFLAQTKMSWRSLLTSQYSR